VRILLDHCVDWRLGRSLPGHDVKSTRDLKWETLRNGRLLAAAAERFDVMLTVDQNIRHQQNLTTLPIAVVVVVNQRNKLADLIRVVPAIEAALRSLQPRTLIEVTAPAQ